MVLTSGSGAGQASGDTIVTTGHGDGAESGNLMMRTGSATLGSGDMVFETGVAENGTGGDIAMTVGSSMAGDGGSLRLHAGGGAGAAALGGSVFITTGGTDQGLTGAVEIKSADTAASGPAGRRHLLAGTQAVSGNVSLGSGRLSMNMLTSSFTIFYRVHARHIVHRILYPTNPHLLSQMSSFDVVGIVYLTTLGSGDAAGSSGELHLFTGDSDAAASGSVLVETGDSFGGPGGNIHITVGRGTDVTSGNVSVAAGSTSSDAGHGRGVVENQALERC